MDRGEYLLTQAGSECNEVAHRVSKALQFGLAEQQPGQDLTNAERLVDEFVELLAVVDMLVEEGLIRMPNAEELKIAKARKKERVEKFMRYAWEECGTLSGGMEKRSRDVA